MASGAMTRRDAYQASLNTNVVSVHLFTDTLVDLVLKSSSPRILFISSYVASLTKHSDLDVSLNQSPPAGWPKPYVFNSTMYRTSKTAVNMMALEWGRTLKHDGVKIHIVDPGFMATALGGIDPEVYRSYGAKESIIGGRFIRSVIEGERDVDEGKMVVQDGVTPW